MKILTVAVVLTSSRACTYLVLPGLILHMRLYMYVAICSWQADDTNFQYRQGTRDIVRMNAVDILHHLLETEPDPL